ncbi:acyl-CoA dehydratase activase-related protein [Natranaerobius thermophilus]|uniref:DUF2229 domain-containing protein n=1 Tax=Natranaerobius thermophilus (strain ATCC BAA-1301 / DSM 18059 / JW/NM-WN-LF) TaxID=457570 RepID=B2A5H9_NATTJ|nr:acyl-CoA dehydratase activase-related protein [Natranaerobius thermophilus]ACB85334.1 conserved hypothetical protein [Natranaerobius thermophilus JW/NM-WN-LF]
MKPVIGIPRSLMYHFYSDSLELFFKELGYSIKISPVSNKEILNHGSKLTMLDNCLPVKLHFGHVLSLINRVDYLFIPRLVSLKKREYMCPKFIGIPDLIKQTFPEYSAKLIEPTINYNENKTFLKSLTDIKNSLDLSTWKILKAFFKAKTAYHKTIKFRKKQFTESVNSYKANSTGPRIGIIGHDYVLEDKLLGVPIKSKLHELGCIIYPSTDLKWLPQKESAKAMPKDLYWTKNKALFESAIYLSKKGLIDGLIQINTFPCGPDSVISDLIDRKINHLNPLPTMTLTLDEHTGLSGLHTRIEAFIDLINRRGSREPYSPSHG